jgi:hypothetical protein
MKPVIERGLTGYYALCCEHPKEEYIFDLYVPHRKSYHSFSFETAKCYMDSGQIESHDLDGCFWTRTWNGPKQTDKEKCVEELYKYVVSFINLSPPTNHKGVCGILDKYWPGENKCG